METSTRNRTTVQKARTALIALLVLVLVINPLLSYTPFALGGEGEGGAEVAEASAEATVFVEALGATVFIGADAASPQGSKVPAGEELRFAVAANEGASIAGVTARNAAGNTVAVEPANGEYRIAAASVTDIVIIAVETEAVPEAAPAEVPAAEANVEAEGDNVPGGDAAADDSDDAADDEAGAEGAERLEAADESDEEESDAPKIEDAEGFAILQNTPEAASGMTLMEATPTDESLFHVTNGVITKYDYKAGSTPSDVVIPATINGMVITGIGLNAFAGLGITSVAMPNTVTSIEKSAFENNTGLTSVTLSTSLTALGERAFLGCSALANIDLPDSLTSMGTDVFRSCGLTSITVPSGITSLPGGMVANCSKLSSVSILGSVTTIGSSCFQGTGLASITIPEGITSLPSYTLDGCPKLTSVVLPSTLKTLDGRSIGYCTMLADVIIPANVTTIDPGAFTGSKMNVRLPDHLPNAVAGKPWGSTGGVYWKNIDDSCFWFTADQTIAGLKPADHDGCTHPGYHGANADIEIPATIGGKTVKGFIPYAFYRGNTLRSVTFEAGSSITEIAEHAFQNCEGSLKTVVLPAGLKTIKDYAFEYCTQLTSVTLPNSLETIAPYAFQNTGKLASIALPGNLKTIGTNAFMGSGLTSVTVPGSVTSIGAKAFSNKFMKTATIEGSGSLTMGEDVFSRDQNMQTITFSERTYKSVSGQPWGAQYAEVVWKDDTYPAEMIVTEDGWHFNRVENLLYSYAGATGSTVDVTVPRWITLVDGKWVRAAGPENEGTTYEVKTMKNSILGGKGSFKSITVSEGFTDLVANFAYNTTVGTATLPSTLTGIAEWSFNNSKLQHVNIPEGVTYIGSAAFNNCLLEEIELPSTLEEIRSSAFNTNLLTTLELPASLKSLGDSAFANNRLTGIIKIPEKTESIHVTAFANNPDISGFKVDRYRTDMPVAVRNNAPWGAPSGTPVTYLGEEPECSHTLAKEGPLTLINFKTWLPANEPKVNGIWVSYSAEAPDPDALLDEAEAMNLFALNNLQPEVSEELQFPALMNGFYTFYVVTPFMQTHGVYDSALYVKYTVEVDNTAAMTVDAQDVVVQKKDAGTFSSAGITAAALAAAFDPYSGDEATYSISDTGMVKINALANVEEFTTVDVVATYAGTYKYKGIDYPYSFTAVKNIKVTMSDKVTVTFDANAGGDTVTGMPDPQTFDYKGKAAEPSTDPSREGYDFGGWFEDLGCLIGYNFDKVVTENITLYAKWAIKVYDVTFDTNAPADETGNVSGDPDDQRIDHGQRATEPAIAPSIPGYAFAGWYTDAACPDSAKYDFTKPVKGNIDLFAKWNILSYEIIYNANAGGDTTVANMPSNGTAEYKATFPKPAEVPTRTGYTFDAWYKDATCTEKWNFTKDKMPIGGVELFAGWTLNTYPVTFDINTPIGEKAADIANKPGSQTIDHGSAALEPAPAPELYGFTFGGWYTDAACSDSTRYDFAKPVTGTLDLYAKWTPQSFLVSFDANAGNDPSVAGMPASQSVVYKQKATQPGEPTRNLQAFTGWYADPACNTSFDFDTPITKDVTAFAGWKLNVFQITFDSQGATEAAAIDTLSLSAAAGTPILSATGFPSNPTKPGFVFRGWRLADGSWLTSSSMMPSANVHLTAVWERGTVVVVGDITIVASNFIMTLEEAKLHQAKKPADCLQELIDRGYAKAWWTDSKEDVAIYMANVKPSKGKGDKIDAIAGEYQVTYFAKDKGEEVQCTVIATVYDNAAPNSGIGGYDFTYNIDKGPLTEDQVRELGGVTVYDGRGNKTDELGRINPDDLVALNEAIRSGKTGPIKVRFTNAAGDVVTLTVTLTKTTTPAEPVTPATPSTPGTPAPVPVQPASPIDTVISTIVTPAAEVMQDIAATVIPDAPTPAARQISDDGAPLAEAHAWCWVHYYIGLFMALMLGYVTAVVIRRRKFTADLGALESRVLGRRESLSAGPARPLEGSTRA